MSADDDHRQLCERMLKFLRDGLVMGGGSSGIRRSLADEPVIEAWERNFQIIAEGTKAAAPPLSKEQLDAATGLFQRMNDGRIPVDLAVFNMFGLLLGAAKMSRDGTSSLDSDDLDVMAQRLHAIVSPMWPYKYCREIVGRIVITDADLTRWNADWETGR